MFWATSQLFWRIVGLYVLLSLLALVGLIATLNAQIRQQVEDLHQADAVSLLQEVTLELSEAADSAASAEHWRASLLTHGCQLWLVDFSGRSLIDEAESVPDRAVIKSAIRTAARTGEAIRWLRESGGQQEILIAARRSPLPSGTEAVALLLCDTTIRLQQDQLFAAAVTRGVLITWLIGVICVAFVATGLVTPLRVLTENLGSAVEPVQRQDMLLRISDRRDELGNVAQSLTRMEEERADRIQALQDAGSHSRSAVDLLSAVLDSMVEGVIAIDGDERILFLNGAARRLLGINDAIGLSHRLYEAVRIPAMLDTITESLRTAQMQSLEFRTTREGLSLAMVVNPIRQGSHSGAVAVVRDVSERRRLEAMRRDFVSGVSHELKTPLTVIQACTDTLLEGAVDDSDLARRFLKQIDEQSERLLQLILGMLQLARLESGTEVFRFERVPLHQVVAEVIAAMEPVAESRRISLTRQGLPQMMAVADYQAVRTVISNLLDNAVKHTPEGGSVILSLRMDDDSPVLTVRDTGVGISPEHLGRIFERFYRVDRDRSRERGGTGLGLAIVKHLCHTMKAVVSVHSAPGEGTEFRIVFPVDKEQADQSSNEVLNQL